MSWLSLDDEQRDALADEVGEVARRRLALPVGDSKELADEVLVVFPQRLRGVEVFAETLGKYDEPRVCEFFGVTDGERKATAGDLADLVCERVALLVVER